MHRQELLTATPLESTMAGGKTKNPEPRRVWEKFARRQRNHPLLAVDPLYALTDKLIDILTAEVPGLFSERDLAFERDLARTVSGGFYYQRPFQCLLCADLPAGPQADRARQIETLLAQSLKDEGLNPLQIQRLSELEQEQKEHYNSRAAAYAGWLIAHPQFRQERDSLRQQEGARVASLGGFPSLPRSFLFQKVELKHTTPEDISFFNFYDRWGLSSFLTWELPLPLEPELAGLTTYDPLTIRSAGVNLFLPWYLLRDRSIRLQDLIDSLKKLDTPKHLKGWLESSTKQEGLGYTRWWNLLVLYRYRNLALASRYPDQLHGNTERLDRAFASFLEVDPTSIKKLRLDMHKRLRG
jgi:hypothetical protein